MRWPQVKLELLAADVPYAFVGGPFGSKLTTRDYVRDGIPVIRGSNFKGGRYLNMTGFAFVSETKMRRDLAGNLAREDDLVFTQRGTLGQVAMIPKSGVSPVYVISQSQMKLTIDENKADRDFVYYYCSSPEAVRRIKSLASSSGVPHINLSILRKFEIPLPPLEKQKRIASILSNYDKLIANSRRRIALLDRVAREIYREWFVRLRFPGREYTKIINGVPKGWGNKALGDIANITIGQSPKSAFYNVEGNGLPFHQGVKDFGERFPSHTTYCTVDKRLAEPDDILFSVRAPVGRINITVERVIIGRGLAAIRSNRDQQNMLFYALKSQFFKEDILGSGAIYAAITKKDLYGIQILNASDDVAELFLKRVRPLDLQIKLLHRMVERLIQARDLLLPRVMDGRVAV